MTQRREVVVVAGVKPACDRLLPRPADAGLRHRRGRRGAFYAGHFQLPVELDSRVRAVRRAGSGYAVELDDRSYEAEPVVIATGPFQVPFVAAIADGLGAAIVQMHSTADRSPGSVPNHVHGAGRFLVLSRDGVTEPNLVWKDTVLVRAGDTVDILLDVTNVGRWMAHCHIAEHHESGMMFSFEVTE